MPRPISQVSASYLVVDILKKKILFHMCASRRASSARGAIFFRFAVEASFREFPRIWAYASMNVHVYDHTYVNTQYTLRKFFIELKAKLVNGVHAVEIEQWNLLLFWPGGVEFPGTSLKLWHIAHSEQPNEILSNWSIYYIDLFRPLEISIQVSTAPPESS